MSTDGGESITGQRDCQPSTIEDRQQFIRLAVGRWVAVYMPRLSYIRLPWYVHGRRRSFGSCVGPDTTRCFLFHLPHILIVREPPPCHHHFFVSSPVPVSFFITLSHTSDLLRAVLFASIQLVGCSSIFSIIITIIIIIVNTCRPGLFNKLQTS